MTIRIERKAAVVAAWLLGSATAVCAAGPDTGVERGRAVFAQWCVSCHGTGQHTPGTMALFFKYGGKVPPILELRSDLTPEVLRVFVRNGVSVMPSFRKTELSDTDVDSIAAYLKDSAEKAPMPPAKP